MEFLRNIVVAFVVGGLFCLIGQIFIDYTNVKPARILVTYVVVGVALTAIGLYEPLVNFAGAGATVPLTGFGYALAKGVEKAVTEHGLLGALAGGLTATSVGITAAVVLGVVSALVTKPRPKD